MKFLELFTELRETIYLVDYQIIRKILKDTNEERDEEIHRARPRSVPSTGPSGPKGLVSLHL